MIVGQFASTMLCTAQLRTGCAEQKWNELKSTAILLTVILCLPSFSDHHHFHNKKKT